MCVSHYQAEQNISSYPLTRTAASHPWPRSHSELSLETDLRRLAVLGVDGSKDPRFRDLSREGVRGGELGGSKRGLNEEAMCGPLFGGRGGGKREEAENLSRVS